MSSVYSSGSRVSSRQASDNTIVKFWDEHIKGMLFGVMYAMVKENTMGKGFTIVTIVFEFLEMIILCFREQFKWGGLKYSFDFDDSMIGYSAFRVIFWMIVAIIGLALVMCGYIGYTFYKGEIKLTFLLRIFRYIVGVFMSILFLPFLFFLFSALACDYSTKPTATLLLYHSESCWGSHTIPAIISIVLVVAFSLLCLFASTTLYEHDPTINKSCGKLQNRFEFFSLSMRLVYIIVTVFLMKNSIAFAAVAFWVSLLLFIASVLTLPCYDHKLNLMRSGMYAGVIWVNIGMIISLATQSNSIVPLLISLVGFPIAMLAGAFAADRRFKYLCNPTLVDGFVSSEMETLPAQKKKKSVNFEGPSKSNKLVKNQLYSRLWFPWDVEIAARFANGNPNAALIEKGKLVYQTGISKFPKSPSVMQGYANFMFTTVGDWQLGYVILEKLRKMRAVIDIQFFIYRYDKDRERRIEGGNDRIGDFMDFMEYKKLQQAARRHHTTSLVCVRKFWRYLLEPKVDVMQLSLLSSKIALAQRKAEEHYTKLLKNYPKNVSLLRDYAKYLDEVALDERQAQEMRRKADKYEQLEMESATASHRSTNNVLPETFTRDGETNSDRDSEARSENSETMDDLTASSKSSGVRAKLVEARLDKNNSLKKLGWIMFATTVFSLAVGLTELIVLDKMISSYSYSLESQNSAGGAAHISMKLSRSVADSYSVGVKTYQVGYNVSYPYLSGSTYKGISSDNIVSTYMFQNILKSLYWGDSDTDSFTSRRFMRIKQKYGFKPKIDISDHAMKYNEFDHKLPNKKNVLNFFNDARYNETLYVSNQNDTDTSISASREYDNVGLWTLCSVFAQTVIEVAKIPLWHYSDSKLVSSHGVVYSYSLENSQEIAKGMLDVVTFYANRISDSLQLIMLTCMIIFIVAAALLIIASIGMFRPIVQKIFTAKVRTFSMFTIIPTSVVKVMSRRRIAAASHNYSSDEEEEKEDKRDYFTEESGKDGATQEPTGDNEQEQVTASPHELISFDSFKNNVAVTSDDDNSPHCLTINVVSSSEGERKEDGDEKEDNKEDDKEEEDEEMKVPDTPIRAMKRRISSLSNLFRIKTNYKKVEDEKEKEEEKHKEEKIEQEKKKQIHSKHSRLDTSSLSAVTRKLHLSYLIAIGCIVISFLVSFLLIRRFLGDLVTIATDMQMADLRTQYIQTLSMDLSLLTVYPYGDPVADLYYGYSLQDMQNMWLFYNDIEPKSYQMDILYSENCFIINSTACPDKTDYRYDLVSNGFDYAFFKYYMITKDLLSAYQTNKVMDIDNPNYAVFRYLADWMIDGSETLTYLVYRDAKDRIGATKNYIAIITAVECVAFILIHVIIFKPFVTQLKNESDHTFALIRMIPRKLLQNVPEIQQFIQDTLAGDDSDSE